MSEVANFRMITTSGIFNRKDIRHIPSIPKLHPARYDLFHKILALNMMHQSLMISSLILLVPQPSRHLLVIRHKKHPFRLALPN